MVYSYNARQMSPRTISNVNTVSTTTSVEDVKKLSRYINDQPLKEVPDTFTSTTKSAIGSLALFNGIPYGLFLFRNLKHGTKAFSKLGELSKMNRAAFSNIFKGTEKLGSRISAFLKTAAGTAEQYAGIKGTVKKIAKGKIASSALTVTAIDTTAKTASKGLLSKVGGALKRSGAIGMMAISGIIEGATEVYPTFKELGKEKGFKQLGKSAIKVAADTTGYLAAAQVGTAIGGLISPGFGHALGFVAGFVGSFIAGKITKAIIGKPEREIAAEQKENQNAATIAKNNQEVAKLKAAAASKIKEETAAGTLSKDSAEIAKLLNKKPTFKATV